LDASYYEDEADDWEEYFHFYPFTSFINASFCF
jgi:hypothetical protein